jgi:hypothetical protein
MDGLSTTRCSWPSEVLQPPNLKALKPPPRPPCISSITPPHLNATIQFKASEMCLHIHSDASYTCPNPTPAPELVEFSSSATNRPITQIPPLPQLMHPCTSSAASSATSWLQPPKQKKVHASTMHRMHAPSGQLLSNLVGHNPRPQSKSTIPAHTVSSTTLQSNRYAILLGTRSRSAGPISSSLETWPQNPCRLLHQALLSQIPSNSSFDLSSRTKHSPGAPCHTRRTRPAHRPNYRILNLS